MRGMPALSSTERVRHVRAMMDFRISEPNSGIRSLSVSKNRARTPSGRSRRGRRQEQDREDHEQPRSCARWLLDRDEHSRGHRQPGIGLRVDVLEDRTILMIMNMTMRTAT